MKTKLFKPILSLFFAIFLAVGVMSTNAYAAGVGDRFYGLPFWDESTAASGLLYEIISLPTENKVGEVRLIKSDEIAYSETSYEIPDWVKNPADSSTTNYYIVVEIGNSAFMDCKDLESVEIPNTVKVINDRAFFACSKLTSINIPNGVETIGKYAFYNCESLTSMTLPNSITTIEADAFAYCKNLESINIPSGLTSISNNTFANCFKLENVEIPEGVTAIGSGAFIGCQNFTIVTIPSKVKSIGQRAFFNCVSIAEITVPSNVIEIGSEAFSMCNNLNTVTVMYHKEKNIASNAFSDTPAEKNNNVIHKLVAPVVTVNEETQTVSWVGSSGVADTFMVTFFSEAGVQQTNGIETQGESINYAQYLNLASPGRYYCTVVAYDEIFFNDKKQCQPSDAVKSDVFTYGDITPKKLPAPVVTVDESTQTISWEIDPDYEVYADTYRITFFDENGVQQTNPSTTTEKSVKYPQYLMNYGKYYCTVVALDNIQSIGDAYADSDPAQSAVFTYSAPEAVTYTVTATAGKGGSITPESKTVEAGEDVEFTVKAKSGYKLKKLTLDGVDVTDEVTGGKYTLTDVQDDHELKATFKKVGGSGYSGSSAEDEKPDRNDETNPNTGAANAAYAAFAAAALAGVVIFKKK